MISYSMEIRLLSDLCVSDGGVYNSTLDTDICKDVKGFPYIPAKRIKGCLKESAQELADWGEKIEIDLLFGKKGDKNNAGILRISDAVLEESLKYQNEIKEDEPVYHSQHILNLYSYVRTQTAIDRETGTAKEKSLRTMRVAKKGLIFKSKIGIDDTEIFSKDSIEESLKQICANLTHMGIARTRGFGEVAVSLKEEAATGCNKENNTVENDADILEYELYLEEPVICKNAAGSMENSDDYIEGSKIMGIIADRYRKKKQEEITVLLNKGRMQFSNAYIAINHHRFTEVPAYIYGIKNDKEHYIQKIYDQDDKASKDSNKKIRQLNQMKHTYIQIEEGNQLLKENVKMEKRYHHRRPEDKSIGRAAVDESYDSEFYQISSISRGQSFKGFIKGSVEQIKMVAELLKEDKNCYIGYGRSSEYGKVRITSIEMHKEKINEIKSDKILLTLISPAIVYNEKAMYSGKAEDLVEELLSELGISEKYQIEQRYIKYNFIGGYNVTWNMRKPMVQVFDKGTAVVLKFARPVSITYCGNSFLGERKAEGFGEFIVESIEQSSKAEFPIIIKEKQNCHNGKGIDLKENPLADEICRNLFLEFFRGYCSSKIEELSKESNRAVVSNMMLMCSENEKLSKVKESVQKRYGEKFGDKKQEKYDIALQILTTFDGTLKLALEEFEKCYHVSDYECEDAMKVKLLNVMLQQIKYAIRSLTKNGEE